MSDKGTLIQRFLKTRRTLLGYAKEGTLLFLSLFYFVIATNTQTGWLFVLSAFLLGLLGLSWVLSRRALDLQVEQNFMGDPQRDHPIRVRTKLHNGGKRTVQEPRIEADSPDWAAPGKGLAWAIPTLSAGETVQCEYRVVPRKRGEHTLPPSRIVSGAPCGLFTKTREIENTRAFLVYPAIEKLPTSRSRSRLSTALGELTSPSGLGDTHSLRSLREYRFGDDLRQVHWKASAKRSAGSPLLIREHHAPTPARLCIVLDSGCSEEEDHLFERAVTLAASILWSAHREGLLTQLWVWSNGEWHNHGRWQEQYTALARVQRTDACPLEDSFELSDQLVLLRAAHEQSAQAPQLFRRVFTIVDPNSELRPDGILIDGLAPGFQEI